MRKRVCETARTYLDVPWRHQGRTRFGVDCLGLLIVTGKDVGLVPADFDYNGYEKFAHPIQFMKQFHEYMEPLRVLTDVKEGDVIIVNMGKVLTHCGIVSKGTRGFPTFIHADSRKGFVIEEPAMAWLNPNVAKRAFKYKGIE